MSKTVDERVVSMQFDNRNFEQNAKTSMSTLDKLKQKLNLSGAAKGLNEIDSAAKKVNFNPLGNAVESVKVKFSAFEVMAVTALTNITNKAVNAGEQLLKSLTIDNVTAGWSKYEQKTASVQTILNATGKSIDEVNEYLDKLMWFSDETSYGFNDMTKALATMTSTGGDIDKLIPLIMGVANATAFAGKGAAEFSRIMEFGINQAYSLGYMQVQDWKSIESATVGSKQLKEILIQAAEELGKIEKGTIDASNFRSTLADKWLDTDVMEAGFGKFAEMTEKAYEMVESGVVETASEAYEQLSSQYDTVSLKAAKAAQEAKTFTEAIDATKDAVSSGWMKSFEIIFGNYEQAKELWTDLANFLWDVFASGADRRNEVLEMVFGGVITSKVFDKIESITKVTTEAIEKVTDLGKVVDDVINGKYGNTEERWNKLTEEGYDWIRVQNLVNEKLGNSYRRQEQVTEATEDAAEATGELKEATDELSDALLKEIGLTEEEIEIFRKLQEISKRTGIPLEELNGRLLLLEGIKNIGRAIADVFRQVKNAWSDTFSPLRPVQLLNIIDKFNQFTESLRANHETSYKLYRTFRGLFALIDLIATIAGGAFRIAFTIAKELLRYFGYDLLDVTAAVGDAITRFRNWLKSLIDVEAIVEVIGPLIARAVNAVRSFVKSIKESKAFQTFVDRIRSVTTAIREWFAGMKDAENLPQYIANGIGTAIGYILKFARDLLKNLIKFITGGFRDIPGYMADGFVGGLGAGIKKVGQGMVEFARTIIDRVKEILDIHSPSKVFFAIGGFVVAGFILGFRDKIGEVFPALGEFADTVVNFIKGINFGKLFATAGSIAMLAFAKSMMDVAGGLTEVLEGVGSVLVSFAYTAKKFAVSINRVSKGIKHALDAMAFKQLAIAIAILVGSVVVLALIDPDKLWNAVKVIAALAGIMAALFVVCNLNLNFSKVSLGSKKTLIEFGKIAAGLFALGASILLIAIAAKMIADIDPEAFERAKSGLLFIAVIMVGMMAATQLMAKSTSSAQTLAGSTKTTTTIAAIGATLMQMAAALLILVVAAKMISGMDWSEMAKAAAGLLFLAGIMVGLMAATKLLAKTKAGSINAGLMSVGKMLLSMAAAMLILVIAAKIIAGMSWDEMAKAGAGLVVLAGLLVGLVAATQLIVKTAKGGLSTQITKIGTMLLSIAAAILILSIAAKIIAGMSWEDMGKAAVGITALAGVMVGLVAATKLAGGKDLKGVATTLIAMAGAIALMTFSVLILSLLDTGALAKGVIAVGLLGAVVIGMAKATEKAHNVKGTMMGLAIAIGIMAVSIVLLSLIDPLDLIGPTLAMAALMGMFTLMEKGAGKTKQAMKTVYALAVVVAVMGLVLGLLSLLPVQNVLGSAVALSLLMLAMAGVISILGKTMGGSAGKNALRGVIVLAALAIPLLAFVGILACMSGVQNALTNVIALSLLTAAMTVLLIPLALAGKFMKDALKGVIALTAMALPLIAFTGVLACMSGVQNALTNVIALTILAAAMTALLIPLTVIGAIMTSGIGAAAVLLGIVALTAMAVPMITFVGILAIMSGIQNATENAMLLIALMTALTGILVCVALVAPLALVAVVAINALLGVIVAIGALAIAIGALMTEFPQLEEFLNKGLPILEQIAGSIGTMIGKFVAGLASEVAGILPYLGLCLGQFMTNAMPFIAGAKLVDESVLIGVGVLAGSILALTAASVIEGIASFLTGGSSFADLGTQLSLFMLNALPFITAAKQIDPSIVESVGALADVILKLTASNLLESLTSWLTGGSSLSKFGAELATFGPYMRAFADAVAGINPESVRAAADAGKILAEMANTIPNQGGVVGWFAGENSLGSFGPQIVSFGHAIADFSTAVAGISVESVRAACEAGKAITDMANTIPNQGGIVSWFAGENSLAAFGPQVASFGKHLASFASNVAGIDPASVTAAAQAGKDLAKMAETVPNQGGIKSWFSGDNSVAAFGGKIASFGKHLKTFSDNVAGVNPTNIAAASEAGKNLAKMASEVPKDVNIGTFGIQLVSFGKSMESFAKQVSGIKIEGLNTTVIEFKGMMKKIADIGREGANGLVDAFKDAKSSMVTAATELGKAALKGVESANLRSKFSTLGKQCAEGFAAGITANTFMPQARAVAMATAALNAAKAVLRINSPSKAFRDIGMSVPEGFAMGIDKLGGMVKNSAVEMADGAIDGTKTAIAIIADAINSDIETQPTIRPVLDLSDVRSGANSLSGMLAMTPSVGVLANVGAISSMMNNRQNGGNDDVVSALNDLKSSLSGRTGDSYTINGITYDDGTNVSAAVKELVRAARIERRI